MKRWLIVFASLFVLALAGTAIAQEKGPDKIEFKAPKKGKVAFDHAKHKAVEGVSCKKCHHKTEDGKTPEKCGKCHGAEAKVKSKKAFHNQCKGCHKDMKKGPTKCKECHEKK